MTDIGRALGLAVALALLNATAAAAAPRDTLDVATLAIAPRVDGRVSDDEYGAPAIRLTTPSGEARIWITRAAGAVHIAAVLPDSGFYWGDDVVISVDVDGSGGSSPGAGDRQWYLRRTLDSSVVLVAEGGRWSMPGREPPMLGGARRGADWDVASTSSAREWTVELRVREVALGTGAALPRIAFRTYNDAPHGWWSWPAPPPGVPAQRVERSPDLWIPVRWRDR